ncbi:hypothetical protein [Donghicola mangrovi]|uniref:Uncharacterized protein n=1 Tax=Donghicola mangrovi TaxID=2729614 RepID=A0A850QD72_9RHOB|nr:hypothetical protein [Donghicola mangrovi]NVO24375.1 hypothetical protein [Donghicola mangrovi]
MIDARTCEVKEVLSFLPPGFRPVDVTPVGMALTTDGATALISLGRANHVAVVDVAIRDVRAYVLVGSRAWGVELSQTKRWPALRTACPTTLQLSI